MTCPWCHRASSLVSSLPKSKAPLLCPTCLPSSYTICTVILSHTGSSVVPVGPQSPGQGQQSCSGGWGTRRGSAKAPPPQPLHHFVPFVGAVTSSLPVIPPRQSARKFFVYVSLRGQMLFCAEINKSCLLSWQFFTTACRRRPASTHSPLQCSPRQPHLGA